MRSPTIKVREVITRCITEEENVKGDLVRVIRGYYALTLVFSDGRFAAYTLERGYEDDYSIEFNPINQSNYDVFMLKDLGLLTSDDLVEQLKEDEVNREEIERCRELSLLAQLKEKYEKE